MPSARKPRPVPPSVPARPYVLVQLKDSEFAAAYVEAVLEEKDAAALRLALCDVLDARCKATNASAKNRLRRRLSATGGVHVSDLTTILAASGLRLSVKPAAA